ncbi:hypothetical protein CK203_064833 [Vitis vinifera]|uniref:DUF4283 domain-containing protein n=1 Tax=Vitis vinifera TaxID=29760 RepID=A0A438G768_VITVI|nr:hypothetical protein CK203_064833 [Vitis vinifera]
MRARGKTGGSRGGRSCFVVEAKSFEILIDELGGKRRGCIWERSKGVSSWIRFGEASLRCLLDGVEVCCREVNNSVWATGWEEGNRKYRLERRSNGAGRFIFCSVRNIDSKKYSIIVPEGKGQSFGWNSLAERLRALGVIPSSGLQGPKGSKDLLRSKGGSKVQWREKGVELKTYADAVRKSPGRVGQSVWIEVEEGEVRGRIEQMSQCLVGWWGPSLALFPEMEYVRSWALKHWALKGNLRVATLGRGLLLFDFELPDEAERVLARGLRIFKENVLVLERWNPEVFKRIGDEFGGFIAADKSSLHEMQWARLLVRCVDREMPNTAHIVVGSGCYSLQLWWESSPWFTQVVPAGSFSGESSSREGEEVGGTVRDLSRGSQREKVEQLRLQQGESVVSACGGDSTLCPAVLYEAGDAVEGRVGSADGQVREGDGFFLNKLESPALGPSIGPKRPAHGVSLGLPQLSGLRQGPFKETQEDLGCVLRLNVSYGEKGEGFGPVGPVAAEGGDLNGKGISSPRARAQSPGVEKGSGDADSLVRGEAPSASRPSA